jgi:hypothetical protein
MITYPSFVTSNCILGFVILFFYDVITKFSQSKIVLIYVPM